jgi:hypothetical protein
MPDTVLVLGISGAIISALLSVIAVFLKMLLQDFRSLQRDFLEVKSRQLSLRAEIDRISEVLLLLRTQLQKRAQRVSE